MMDRLVVTVVGKGLIEIMTSIFNDLGLTPINLPTLGMLGNFNLYAYGFDIPEENFISIRRSIMDKATFNNTNVSALYEHGDYRNVYIFRKSAFKTYNIIE